ASWATSPQGAATGQSIAASAIAWTGIYGVQGEDVAQVYVLLAREFLGLPFVSSEPKFCDALPKIEADWLGGHRSANVLPVRRVPVGEGEELAFVFVWIVDGEENLNVELVRQGCTEARRMEVENGADLLVPREAYQRFIESVKHAEATAIQDKAGIWSSPGT